MNRLEGKVAIVTGAAQGMGEAHIERVRITEVHECDFLTSGALRLVGAGKAVGRQAPAKFAAR